MKLIFFSLLSFLISISVWAAPQVGDYANYDASDKTGTNNSDPMPTLIRIVDYDVATKLYSVSVQFDSGNPLVTKQTLGKIQPYGTSKEVYANCLKLNGTFGSATVPAGIFKACVIHEEDGDRWFSPQSPLEVKSVYRDGAGGIVTFELREYHWHF